MNKDAKTLSPLKFCTIAGQVTIGNHEPGINTSFYSPEEHQLIAINALKNMHYQNALIGNHHFLRLKVNRQELIINQLDLIIRELKKSLAEH